MIDTTEGGGVSLIQTLVAEMPDVAEVCTASFSNSLIIHETKIRNSPHEFLGNFYFKIPGCSWEG